MEVGETILEYWEITAQELTTVVRANPSLRGMLFGYVAELKLYQFFAADPRITSTRKDDDHDRRRKGDLVLTYKGHEFKIESKSLQTNSIVEREGGYFGRVQCDASDRRPVTLPSGVKLETTCLLVGEFDVLAACLFEFRKKWDFSFALNSELPRSTYSKYSEEARANLLKSLMDVSWPPVAPFVSDPFELLDVLVEERERS